MPSLKLELAQHAAAWPESCRALQQAAQLWLKELDLLFYMTFLEGPCAKILSCSSDLCGLKSTPKGMNCYNDSHVGFWKPVWYALQFAYLC